MRGACKNSFSNHEAGIGKGKSPYCKCAYLWVQIIQRFNSCLNVSSMDTILDFLSGTDRRYILLGSHVCFL